MKIGLDYFFLAALPFSIWGGYGRDSQHTALVNVGSQALNGIHWSAPVDLDPETSGGELLIHYGSPAVSAANTVLLPVKTGAADGFEVQARSGATGALLYTLTSDYSLPPHDWTPPYGLVLSSRLNGSLPGRESLLRQRQPQPLPKLSERLYFPGAGGTVFYRDNVDSANRSHRPDRVLWQRSVRRQHRELQQHGADLDAADRRQLRQYLLRLRGAGGEPRQPDQRHCADRERRDRRLDQRPGAGGRGQHDRPGGAELRAGVERRREYTLFRRFERRGIRHRLSGVC